MKSKQDVKLQKISALALASILTLAVSSNVYAEATKDFQANKISANTSVLNDIENTTIESVDKIEVPVLAPVLTVVEQQSDETTAEPPVAEKSAEVDIPAMSGSDDFATPKVAVNNAPIPQHTDYQNDYIPVIAEAKVFANLTDELPAVMNYFTVASEEQVIDFYQQAYGESTSHERKRGRLTLTYQQGEQSMRVVISTQADKRQVDVLVESAVPTQE